MLNKPALIIDVKAALDRQSDVKVNPAEARAAMAVDLANAFEKFVKSGTVTVTVAQGIAVTTAGTAAAQTGATVATGTGTGAVN